MEVLKYLQSNTLETLNSEYSIKVKEYPEHNIAVLNYNQIDSPKYHPIVMECRGLIINTKTLTVVSRTFQRFFNLNENENDPFDFDSGFRAEEKADGSIMSVYHHNDSWHIASRGNAFAEGTTASGISFKEIFETIIGTDINTYMGDRHTTHSYTFEMCSIYNKVVKVYTDACLYLLNIYDLELKMEYGVDTLDLVAEQLNVKRPIVYDIESVDDIRESFKDFEPTEEGYVLIDVNRNRIKVKNPAYVDLHHMKGNGEITPKRIADVVFRGESKEILSYFPEFKEVFRPWEEAYESLINNIDEWSHLLGEPELSQKAFAISIQKLHFKGILFSMRKGLTMEASFDKMGKNSKVVLLEYYIN